MTDAMEQEIEKAIDSQFFRWLNSDDCFTTLFQAFQAGFRAGHAANAQRVQGIVHIAMREGWFYDKETNGYSNAAEDEYCGSIEILCEVLTERAELRERLTKEREALSRVRPVEVTLKMIERANQLKRERGMACRETAGAKRDEENRPHGTSTEGETACS